MSNDVLIEAYKVQVAELLLARKQANEMLVKLMHDNLSEGIEQRLFGMIQMHQKEAEAQRSGQLATLMGVTLLQLNQMAQQTADQKVKQGLIKIIESFNIVLASK